MRQNARNQKTQKQTRWFARSEIVGAIILAVAAIIAATIPSFLARLDRAPSEHQVDQLSERQPEEVTDSREEVAEVTQADEAALPRSRTILLHDGRFTVSTNWLVGETTQRGTVVAMRRNLVIVAAPKEKDFSAIVKLLDARSINGSFWVFLWTIPQDGLIGELIVSDTRTGKTKTYQIPEHDKSIGEVLFQSDEAVARSGEACLPNNLVLCFVNNRFGVTLRWGDHRTSGEWHDGLAIRFSETSGFFRINEETGYDWVIRAQQRMAGEESYRFLVSSCTDIPWVISFTDFRTGAVKQVVNEQGRLKSCTSDTEAFDA